MAEEAELTSPSSETPWMLDTILEFPETSEWSGGPYDPYKLVDLPATSVEFKRVNGDFTASVWSYRVSKIQRIENPFLLAQFLMKKQKINGVATEKHLFHGTDSENIDGICKHNFDWRRRGSSRGHKFGQGISFARDAFYATHYTRTNTMIYARVLVGKSVTGEEQTQLPPDPFDTTQNVPGTVFVKYEDDDCYPNYVIYYVIAQTTVAMMVQINTSGAENLSTLPVTTENLNSSLGDHSSSHNKQSGDRCDDSKDHHCELVPKKSPSTEDRSLSPSAAGASLNGSSDCSDSNHQSDDVDSNYETDYSYSNNNQSDDSDDSDSSRDSNSDSESESYFDSVDDDFASSVDESDDSESSVDEGDDTDMNDLSDANFGSNMECDDFDMTGNDDDDEMDVD